MSGASGLRESFQFLLGRDAAAWPRDFRGIKPVSLRELLASCQDPHLHDWINPSRGKVEDRPYSEEANGIGTDGDHWFVSTNAGDGREGLWRLKVDGNGKFQIVTKLSSPFGTKNTHIGALGVRNGWVYVTVEDEGSGFEGIWKVSTDFDQSTYLRYEALPDDDHDMFSWCDLNPHNGFLYTCAFADVGDKSPEWLRAYKESDDPNTLKPHAMDAARMDYAHGRRIDLTPVAENQLVRVSDYDIPLVESGRPNTDRPTIRVQGGCFTDHHKWLAVSDDPGHERIHCYSTITGAFLGFRRLLADTDEGSPGGKRNELEDICVADAIADSGRPIQVHVLELNNEWPSTDDFYLWHFSVPEPEAL